MIIGRMLNAVRNEGWIVGIAVAAALAYVTIRLFEELVAVLLAIIDGVPAGVYEDPDGLEGLFDYPYSAVINGHFIFLEPLLRATVLFVVVVVGSALVLRATRSDDELVQGHPSGGGR